MNSFIEKDHDPMPHPTTVETKQLTVDDFRALGTVVLSGPTVEDGYKYPESVFTD